MILFDRYLTSLHHLGHDFIIFLDKVSIFLIIAALSFYFLNRLVQSAALQWSS